MNTIIVSLLACFFYAGGLLLKSRDSFQRQIKHTNSLTKLLLLLGILVHIYSLYLHIYQENGVNLSFFNIASLIACFSLSIIWVAIIQNIEIDNTLFIVIPLCILCLLANEFSNSQHQVTRQFGSGLLTHILLSILAYSTLTIAGIQALLLFIQEENLKRHGNIRFLSWLPSLETMENLLFSLLSFGLLLLTAAIVTGMLYIEDIFAQRISHKLVFTLLSWLIFITLLAGRYFYGWRGLTAIKWTIAGCIALMLAYFGSQFVIQFILSP